MYSLKKMTQKISKTYTLSFPKAAHSLEAQDQGAVEGGLRILYNTIMNTTSPLTQHHHEQYNVKLGGGKNPDCGSDG